VPICVGLQRNSISIHVHNKGITTPPIFGKYKMKKSKKKLNSRITRILNISLPLYFVTSVVLLFILSGLFFGYLAQRVEQKGPENVFLGKIVRKLAGSPIILFNAMYTIQTHVKQFNPMIEGHFLSKNLTRYNEVKTKTGLNAINGIKLYSKPTRLKGWRVVVGCFDIAAKKKPTAILFDENMHAVHIWPLDEKDVPHADKRAPLFKFPHGFEILPDGSIFYSFDGGVSLKHVDIHGQTLWHKIGYYHHAITLAENGQTLWSLRHAFSLNHAFGDTDDRAVFDNPKNRFLEQLDTETGNTLQTITLADIASANKELSILKTRRPNRFDPYHENDVEPLPVSFAEQFPQFSPGDLLVSIRNANLVFVMNPQSHKVKWWRMGMAIGQHDPDWLPDGSISVFDNGRGIETSRIIKIDHRMMTIKTILAGEKYNFNSNFRGKHQVLPDGSILVSSTLQGRFFEVSPSGEIVFELINFVVGETEKVLQISEAKWLPPGFFTPEALSIFRQECIQ
jgi:hypothetical protein